MAEKILVTSGKGGVGKSTISTMLGFSLAALSKKVLIVEMDFGMRCLDILNGVSDAVVYDIGDILEQRCEPLKAIVQSRLSSNLFILCAPTNPDCDIDSEVLIKFLKGISMYFDYVLIDSPAGCGDLMMCVLPCVDKALVVTNPSPVSVRDCGIATQLIYENGVTDARLIINRVPKRLMSTDIIPDLDAVIDIVGAQLIGVIPEDSTLEYLQCGTDRLEEFIKSTAVFNNIARRILGEEVNLAVK